MKQSIIFLIFIGIIIGCSQKENSPTEPDQDNFNIPSIQVVTFSGPSKTNTDPTYHAMTASSYALSFGALFQSAVALTSMPAQRNGNLWQWIIPQNNLTITVQVEKKSDGSYSWQCLYNGVDDYGNRYNNVVIWKGEIKTDGKSGSWEFYDPDTKKLENKFSYEIDAQGKKTGIYESFTEEGILEQRAILVNNTNGSGYLDVYELYSGFTGNIFYKSMHIEWDADGSGRWQEFDSNGNVTQSGNWT